MSSICDNFPGRRSEGSRLVQGRSKCFVDAVRHSPNVSRHGCRLDVLAEFCPVFVCAAPSSLLSLAPGNPENLYVPLTRSAFVLCEGSSLGFNDRGHHS